MSQDIGAVAVQVNGETYRLFLGMSVIADLQKKLGDDFLHRLDAPERDDEDWMPDMSIILSVIEACLQRYHAGDVDRWLVDDIVMQNPGVFERLMGVSMPDASESGGAAVEGNVSSPEAQPG